jgi:hypothetical protein
VRDRVPDMEAPDDAHCFLEPRGSGRPRVERDADPQVLVLGPSGADAELHTTVGQDVDLGSLTGQEHRMTEVVVVHVATQAQRRRHDGGCRESWRADGGVVKVISDEQGREPEPFDPSNVLSPATPRSVSATSGDRAEPQRTRCDGSNRHLRPPAPDMLRLIMPSRPTPSQHFSMDATAQPLGRPLIGHVSDFLT